MNYFCNPINVNYRFQFNGDMGPKITLNREAADPSMICFKGKYYIFASMTLGVWVSDNIANWTWHPLPTELPLYEYAPDARVSGDYVYFTSSRAGSPCKFYRTKDILNGPYECIPTNFAYWDPNLFFDEDGRVYFYWGCSNKTPIWGVELDPKTMLPIGEKKLLLEGDPFSRGFERFGDDHCEWPRKPEEIDHYYQMYLAENDIDESSLSPEHIEIIRDMMTMNPYIEGAWMDKHDGLYYLQYACPGAELNVYADGVYVGKHPLGPFHLAKNNPYSYKPGGFIPGAGHGSTMTDLSGMLWHTSTMRISVNHRFERRVGIWPAGFDTDGDLYCNQRYGDWPYSVEALRENPWCDPAWFLLSYKKEMTASSHTKNHAPSLAADENVQTWWQAADAAPGQWLQIDLGTSQTIYAVQINFAEELLDIPLPKPLRGERTDRYIEEREQVTRWYLEGSIDGLHYEMIQDKSSVNTDLSHDFLVFSEGLSYRFLRLTILEVPYGAKPCISGFRIFGVGNGIKPAAPDFELQQISPVDMVVKIDPVSNAVGYQILWGYTPDKLYHSFLTFHTTQKIGALIKDEPCYVRVDTFNEAGITTGTTIKKL